MKFSLQLEKSSASLISPALAAIRRIFCLQCVESVDLDDVVLIRGGAEEFLYRLNVATRNVADFQSLGLEVFNPFEPLSSDF